MTLEGALITFVISIFGLVFLGLLVWLAGFGFVIWQRNKGRESDSLKSVLLQVSVPRDNETKIDAAEQLFASLAALRTSGRFSFIKPQPHLSFEIVGMPGDIRFYVNTPEKLRDFVEKQINGAYPEAEIVPVTDPAAKQKAEAIVAGEYNIFSEHGKVAFTTLALKEDNHKPLKVFKDFAVDPMASLTSVLAKMSEGEGAAIQILIQPADSTWKKAGKDYLSQTKKDEANPETAKYTTDAKRA